MLIEQQTIEHELAYFLRDNSSRAHGTNNKPTFLELNLQPRQAENEMPHTCFNCTRQKHNELMVTPVICFGRRTLKYGASHHTDAVSFVNKHVDRWREISLDEIDLLLCTKFIEKLVLSTKRFS